MTWRAQRRKKRAQKIVTASTPSTAMRIAICGVTRYGSSTRGSGGRKPGRRVAGLDSGPHLTANARRDGEDPPSERVERIAEEHVQREGRQQYSDEEVGCRERRAEHEMKNSVGEAHRNGCERNGDKRRVGGRSTRRFSEPAGEMPGESEEERGESESPERGDVDHEPRPEARACAEDRTSKQRERHD